MSLPAAVCVPELRPLWTTVHGRLSTGRRVTSVRVGPLDEAQRDAVADLLGLARRPGTHCSVSLATLETVLDDLGTDITEVVSDLVGPVGDRAAERARAEAERTALWEWLEDHPEVRGRPALEEWARQVRRAGVRGSVADTRRDLEAALAVLARLPADGRPLPTLAGEVLGDTHALDDGARVSGLVLRALAALFAVPVPETARARRALWDDAGVAVDELSSTVLVAGLRWDGTGPGYAVARACADAGHAAALTLAQLRDSEITGAPPEMWVVENPSILAMALRRFGTRCPPLVCTSGWPNSAVLRTLRRAADLGTRLHHHGDFDGDGLRIVAHVADRTGARPWRMGTGDYLDGLRTDVPSPAPGRVTDAPWDADLAPAIRSHDRVVAEEQVATRLLDDLAEVAAPPPESPDAANPDGLRHLREPPPASGARSTQSVFDELREDRV